MPTSGTIGGLLTARDIVSTSLQIIGICPAGDEPNADDAALAMLQMNFMFKTMQADGCNLWRRTEAMVTIPIGTKTVTLDPRCIDVMEARLQLAATFERSLGRWEWGEYVTMPNKLASGDPTIFVLDKQRTEVTMTVWPVPYVARDVNYTYARVIDDVTDLDQDIDLPQEWTEAVYYCLADRLLDAFSVSTSQPALAQRVAARASMLYGKMLDLDRPASVFMKPWGLDYSRYP